MTPADVWCKLRKPKTEWGETLAIDPQLFRVSPQDKSTAKIAEVSFTALGFKEVKDIQEWIANNPGILGGDLLIVAKEYKGFDKTNERVDLLAVDANGALVIIELKRDDSGADVHWQAIKYASYLQNATATEIVKMLAAYEEIPDAEATERLVSHLDAEDLTALNNAQRIILASHRFAPEVLSAAVWLNRNAKAPSGDLISCVKLIPFQDKTTDTVYLQTVSIIPVPGVEQYLVNVGTGQGGGGGTGRKDDEISRFASRVANLVRAKSSGSNAPDRASSLARGTSRMRRYDLWYSRSPWWRSRLCFRVTFRPAVQEGNYLVHIRLFDKDNGTSQALENIGKHFQDDLGLQPGQDYPEGVLIRDNLGVAMRVGTHSLDDLFAERIATHWREMIAILTPVIDDWYAETQASADEDDDSSEDDEQEDYIGGRP